MINIEKNIKISKILNGWKESFDLEGDKINAGICFGLSTAFKLGVPVKTISIINMIGICKQKAGRNVKQRNENQSNYDAKIIIDFMKSNKWIKND